MRTTILIIFAVAILSSLIAAAQQEHTVDIFAWPLSATKAQTLAQISYTSTNATVKKYTAPKIPADDDIVRVGFYHSSGSWSGVATSASNFALEKEKRVMLHLNQKGELYHVGFKSPEQPGSSKTGKAKDGLEVEIVKTLQGPTPHLNKPVVLNEQGQVDEKEPEKTFLQKYWWVLVGFLVLQLVAAGGGKE